MIQIFLFDRFDLFCFFMLASNDGHESNAVLFGLIFGWCSGTASIGTVSNHRQRHYPCSGTPLDWIGVRTGRHGPERDAKKRHVREVFMIHVGGSRYATSSTDHTMQTTGSYKLCMLNLYEHFDIFIFLFQV
tara:strand:+ start:327 stop:722 length:396 start_codon:yes stop_codon:yes gene_type:complete